MKNSYTEREPGLDSFQGLAQWDTRWQQLSSASAICAKLNVSSGVNLHAERCKTCVHCRPVESIALEVDLDVVVVVFSEAMFQSSLLMVVLVVFIHALSDHYVRVTSVVVRQPHFADRYLRPACLHVLLTRLLLPGVQLRRVQHQHT